MAKSWNARQPPRRSPSRFSGAVVGTLVAGDSAGGWQVDFPGNRDGVARLARTTVGLSQRDLGQSVVLLFEGADPERPIITGVLQPPPAEASAEPVEVRVDGCTVAVSAHRELVLRCGKASLTLTRAGKIILRGTYLLSRSTGVNSIKGGSVQIN